MKTFTEHFLIAALILAAAACFSCSTQDRGVNNPSIKNIMSRKSVRSFADKQIPKEMMEAMLKSAMAAPSGMNTQPWSFVVITDKNNYDKIFEGNYNLNVFKSAGAVIAVCADTTMTWVPRKGEDKTPVKQANPIWRDDMGACTENLLLAAESMGLGAVWTACYPFLENMEPVRAALGLPLEVVPYALVAVGYPAGENEPKDKWKPERVHYEMW